MVFQIVNFGLKKSFGLKFGRDLFKNEMVQTEEKNMKIREFF